MVFTFDIFPFTNTSQKTDVTDARKKKISKLFFYQEWLSQMAKWWYNEIISVCLGGTCYFADNPGFIIPWSEIFKEHNVSKLLYSEISSFFLNDLKF